MTSRLRKKGDALWDWSFELHKCSKCHIEKFLKVKDVVSTFWKSPLSSTFQNLCILLSWLHKVTFLFSGGIIYEIQAWVHSQLGF
jgi:hypothetical protein